MAQSVPRWKTAITNAVAAHEKAIVFQLASIDLTTPVPQVRSHIFRDFIHASAAPSLPLLISTTDIRSPKTTQIISNPHVQLAWWIDETQEQYRISGVASVIPAPDHPLYKHFLHNVKNAVHHSAVAALTNEHFNWEKKRLEVFHDMSAHMKASWCRPAPGTPLASEEEAKKWPERLEEPSEDELDEEKKRNWKTALSNFALVIVDPTEVDFVELSVMPDRRTRFWRTDKGAWDSQALVP